MLRRADAYDSARRGEPIVIQGKKPQPATPVLELASSTTGCSV